MPVEEYLGRIERLKPVVLADADICRGINGTFEGLYSSEGITPDDVLNLGEGVISQVYGVGMIVDTSDGREVYLALKLFRSEAIFVPSEPHLGTEPMTRDLAAYAGAFIAERNPPYFSTLVTAKSGWNPPLRGCGILTEDVSMGKTRELKPIGEIEVEDYVRTNPDGSKEVFFLDPQHFGRLPSFNGGLFLEDRLRIDIP
tara:strand:+ start:271 stop:870 length:600 start_codon:yes stop_codon:yes gene_type:complete